MLSYLKLANSCCSNYSQTSCSFECNLLVHAAILLDQAGASIQSNPNYRKLWLFMFGSHHALMCTHDHLPFVYHQCNLRVWYAASITASNHQWTSDLCSDGHLGTQSNQPYFIKSNTWFNCSLPPSPPFHSSIAFSLPSQCGPAS